MRPTLQRLFIFVALFAVVPAVAATAAAHKVARPYFFLFQAILDYAPGPSSIVIAWALSAACAWAIILAAASLWAWQSTGWNSAARALRLVAALWIVAFVLYPPFASFLPPLTWVPWSAGAALAVVAWALSCVPSSLRPRWREVVLTVAAAAAFFVSPRPARPDLRGIAEREFTARDVILLGFDSVSEVDAERVLTGFTPSLGTKIMYTNATTTVALTGGAWRSVLSGTMPSRQDVLPGTIWPADAKRWLPHVLAEHGYDPAFVQDDPLTNAYAPTESLRVTHPQGWRAGLTEFAWDVAFPLATTGARWWVRALGGPAMEPGEYGYCAECFMRSALRQMAQDARRGPVFFALHTCYAHEPVTLSLRELARIPGWWRRTPAHLRGTGPQMHDASGRSDLALARLGSVQDLLRETLEDLDRTGVLGRATVIVLSDHGPRSREVAIARELTANVMLTAFIPGERKDVIVRDPVSLVDIAPTLAVWLGIDLPQSDGVPLPLESGRGPRRRESTGIAMHPSPVDGLDIWQLSADSVRTLLRFHDDDTFSINRPAFSTLMASMPRADRW